MGNREYSSLFRTVRPSFSVVIFFRNFLLRDHPLKTMAFFRWTGVKSWLNLTMDGSKKLHVVERESWGGGSGQNVIKFADVSHGSEN